MEALLVSPKDPKNPSNLKFLMGGENTYTQSLLNHPPKGVSYTYFSDALKKGDVEHTPWQTFLNMLIKLRILPPDVGYQCLKLNKKFDLIHCHSYCLKLDGDIRPPVVLSDSSSNYLFLKDYLGWSIEKIKARYAIRKVLAEKFHIYDQNLNLNNARLIVWSEFAKRAHQDLGIDPQKIIVIPPGITSNKENPFVRRSRIGINKNSCNILFVGTWFKRKGGELVLSAFKKLKKRYPFISLILIGEPSQEIKFSRDIWHKDYVPRKELMKTIFPKADILVNVPPVAEGYGMVVVEAASFGIPAIVSSVYALPEIVEDGKTGFVIRLGSVNDLAKTLEKLITNQVLREKMGRAAKERFIKKFLIEVTNRKLLEVYKNAL